MDKLYMKALWFECDHWSEPYDENDCNMDVKFTLSDNTNWIATFFTYQNIISLRDKNKTTGECLNGLYFCATDMILVDKITKNNIEKVLNEIILINATSSYCTCIDSKP